MVNCRSRKPDSLRRVQRAKRRARRLDNAEHVNVPEVGPTYPHSLLGNPLLHERGNGPVRVALVQQMQQTYSNHAVQRALQNVTGDAAGQATRSVQLKQTSPPALAVQRDNKQQSIAKVTAAAALTASEEATWSDVSKECNENVARWKEVSERLKSRLEARPRWKTHSARSSESKT